jgi:hypothetical protein
MNRIPKQCKIQSYKIYLKPVKTKDTITCTLAKQSKIKFKP